MLASTVISSVVMWSLVTNLAIVVIKKFSAWTTVINLEVHQPEDLSQHKREMQTSLAHQSFLEL